MLALSSAREGLNRPRFSRDLTMKKLPLNKSLLLAYGDYTAYAVNPLAVRDMSQSDEEFGNFGVHHEFPRLIPEDEIWVADRVAREEGLFFVTNALARLRAMEEGVSEDGAYATGEDVERYLRWKLRGAKFRNGRPHKRVPTRIYVEQYITLPDPDGPGGKVTVWIVDGAVVRDYYKTDYTEGGHGYVYRWVPEPEIWVEASLERAELPFVVAHEYLERLLMRDAGLEYDHAHEICSKVEYTMRECRGPRSPVCPPRKPTKADLPRLTDRDLFDYVVRHYLKRPAIPPRTVSGSRSSRKRSRAATVVRRAS